MKSIALTIIAIFLFSHTTFAGDGIHLVMLTGENPMVEFDESAYLVPALKEALDNEIVIVKSAYQRKGIQHWYSNWKAPASKRGVTFDRSKGWILDELVKKARSAVGDKKVSTLTLMLMQGETDSEGMESAYKESLEGMLDQLREAFGRIDLTFIIARLGAERTSKKQTGIAEIRAAQVEVCESSQHGAWIDTDDSNNSKDIGSRFAEMALKLISKNQTVSASLLNPLRGDTTPAHLILMSGQSNMAGLDPSEAFIPAVNAAFGEENVVVVKAAYGAKSISHWYQWNRSNKKAELRGWIYRELVGKARYRIGDRAVKTITLVWMQGESDAFGSSSNYAENFNGLLNQLREDFNHDDINFVIGRLSDYSNPEKMPEWEQMKKSQMQLAEGSPHGAWINTDDLNGEKNVLHYPDGESGKIALAKRFAQQAIALIEKSNK